MGVNSSDHIYLMTQINIGANLTHSWRQIGGMLKQISCSPGTLDATLVILLPS